MANKSVLVDTSGWIALLNVDDQHHQQAQEVMLQLGQGNRPLVTTDWILAETGNGLSASPDLERAAHEVSGWSRPLRIAEKITSVPIRSLAKL